MTERKREGLCAPLFAFFIPLVLFARFPDPLRGSPPSVRSRGGEVVALIVLFRRPLHSKGFRFGSVALAPFPRSRPLARCGSCCRLVLSAPCGWVEVGKSLFAIGKLCMMSCEKYSHCVLTASPKLARSALASNVFHPTGRQLISHCVKHCDGFRRVVQKLLNPIQIACFVKFFNSVNLASTVRSADLVPRQAKQVSRPPDVLIDSLSGAVLLRIGSVLEHEEATCLSEQPFPKLLREPYSPRLARLHLLNREPLLSELFRSQCQDIRNPQACCD